MTTSIKQIDFNGQNIYVGIDVHKKHFTVTLQGDNLYYKTFNQPPKAELLADYLIRNYPGATYFAAYEAGFSGFWLQDKLTNLGVHCIVVNANDIPTTDKERKQKRDALDSRKIAKGLKHSALRAIHVPTSQQQQDRSLLRARKKIVGNQTRCRNRIKGLLYFYGMDYPDRFQLSGTHWSKSFMIWLKQLDLGHQAGNTSLSLLVQEATFLRDLLLEANKEILKLAQHERYSPQVNLLLSIPGIGKLTSMTLLTELGDITRFKKLDHLCSYLGLIPNVYASGEKERIGGLTKRGNRQLRSNLIESAWVAVRNDPALTHCYHKLCSRMNGNKAIIRIARKLVNRIRYVLLNKEKYVMAVTS